MPVRLLPSYWETERLVAQDSTLDDAPRLKQVVEEAIPEIRGWPSEGDEPERPMSSVLVEPPLPPNGSKEFFRMESIRVKDTSLLMGLLATYHGFPAADVFWIHTLAISPEYQGQGYGPELIRGLFHEVEQLGMYSRMQLYVYLKNWRALRFWTRAGFDRVVEIRGDKVYSDQAQAYVLLEKSLSGEGAQ